MWITFGIGAAFLILAACFGLGAETLKRLLITTVSVGLFIVILAGGFTTNLLWCVFLNVRNRTGRDYLRADAGTPRAANYVFSALAGICMFFAGDYDVSGIDMSMILTGGMMISSGRSGSGFLIEAVYRPLEPKLKVQDIYGSYFGTLALKPSFGLRVAFLFGPGSGDD